MSMPTFLFRCLAIEIARHAVGNHDSTYVRFRRLAVALVIVLTLTVGAQAITITTDTVIGPDSILNGTDITVVDGDDGPTTVRIVDGGTIRRFQASENSHVFLDGGMITFIGDLFDQAQFTLSAGTFSCTALACSVVEVDGLLAVSDHGRASFFGGEFGVASNGVVTLLDNGVASIYGRDLELNRVDLTAAVTGIYADGTPFTIGIALGPIGERRIILHDIPEPDVATLALGCVCAIFLSARTRRELVAT